jgi:DNA-directed RNA polymerase specialized sigma24 family protein
LKIERGHGEKLIAVDYLKRQRLNLPSGVTLSVYKNDNMSNGEINISGIVLLEQMANLEDKDRVREAFGLFCAKFGICLLKYAEVWCEKWGLPISDGERGVDITFERALRHHSFDPSMYEGDDMDRRIEIWLKRILHNVLYDIKANRLSNLEIKDKSLEVIQNTEALYDMWRTGNEDEDEHLMDAIRLLDAKIKGMSENMRIIYLTYMAYETQHQYLPRYLTAKLQAVTGLPQSTIKVYKQRAKKYIQNH